jgi:hypothetical protein
MPITAVSRCPKCEAVINIHWPSCLVCRAALAPGPDLPEATPVNHGQAEVPLAPILSGWLVTYQDRAGKLCGGFEDKAHGTVQACRWEAGRWTVCLTDGQRLSLSTIRAVGQTDKEGRVLSVWTVREHGYDGNGPVRSL